MSLDVQASPSFDRARTISRVITILLTISQVLLGALAVLITVATLFFFPGVSRVFADNWATISNTPLSSFGLAPRLGAIGTLMLAVVPCFLVLFHLRRLFALFARGHIFTDANIAALRATGFWQVLSVILVFVAQIIFFGIANTKEHDPDIALSGLLVGAMIYVAAYVMAEAQRIAADHAEII